jgi:ribosomal protein S18 acetylase RimI-like enzyme
VIRELRRADVPALFPLLQIGFPEEESLIGSTPEGFARVARRIYRWDAQFLLGLLRLVGRPIFRFFVAEEDSHVVGTTILTYPERAGYVSTVMVDPAYRRRGLAQALLERAREATARTGRKYIVLNVLRANAPAIALYERIGYRRLGDGGTFLVRESTGPVPPAPSPSVRGFQPHDAHGLVEITRRATPPEVLEVLPPSAGAIRGSDFVDRILVSSTQAWVVDRGRGPEAHVSASMGGLSPVGHLSDPIVGEEARPEDVAALLRTAIAWCTARGAPRIIGRVAASNPRARAAVDAEGFREAHGDWTLFRPVA